MRRRPDPARRRTSPPTGTPSLAAHAPVGKPCLTLSRCCRSAGSRFNPKPRSRCLTNGEIVSENVGDRRRHFADKTPTSRDCVRRGKRRPKNTRSVAGRTVGRTESRTEGRHSFRGSRLASCCASESKAICSPRSRTNRKDQRRGARDTHASYSWLLLTCLRPLPLSPSPRLRGLRWLASAVY